jgi:hypothetical protein
MLTLLLSLIPSMALSAQADEPALLVVGEAYDNDGGTLLYREYHMAPSDRGMPTRVEYRTEDGEVFAEKNLDYSRSRTAPAIDFRDHRRDLRIVTRYPDDSGSRLEMVYYPSGDEEPERDTFDTDSLIVDAGFDAFIRQHWVQLLDGERLVAEFLVPSRNDTVRVGFTEVDRGRCETDIEDVHCLEVNPAGTLRLLSWFVDPIRVAYRPQPRLLMFYHGRSNIPEASGDDRQVRIHYEHEEPAY